MGKRKKLARLLLKDLELHSNNGTMPKFLEQFQDIADSEQFKRIGNPSNDLTFASGYLTIDDIKKRNKRIPKDIKADKPRIVNKPSDIEPYRRNYIPPSPPKSNDPLSPAMRPKLRTNNINGAMPENTNLSDTTGAYGWRYGIDHGINRSINGTIQDKELIEN